MNLFVFHLLLAVLINSAFFHLTQGYASQNCWTPWFDRDNPSGVGDFETVKDFRREGYKICANPLAIRGRTKIGKISAHSAGQKITLNTQVGLACHNSHQTRSYCHDYEVSFLCPCPAQNCWTSWKDRDNPSGQGDYETLAAFATEDPEVCANPKGIRCRVKGTGIAAGSTGQKVTCNTQTGFFCRNADQGLWKYCLDYEASFLCPCTPPPRHCWTSWKDRDDPSGKGDYETLAAFANEDREVCAKPIGIRCRTKYSKRDWRLTGENVVCNTRSGFYCINSNQRDGRCQDYEVSFLCAC